MADRGGAKLRIALCHPDLGIGKLKWCLIWCLSMKLGCGFVFRDGSLDEGIFFSVQLDVVPVVKI